MGANWRASNRRPWWVFMAPRDVGLFLKSARTDQRIAAVRATDGSRAAFEAAYSETDDPWASSNPRYRYQRWKYQSLMATLPPGRRFERVLDLGSGLGALSQALTAVSGDVLGLDIAQAAVDQARRRTAGQTGLAFAQGDVGALDPALDGSFDLVVVADTIYYMDTLDDIGLKAVSARVSRLLAPDGLCLLANHYFFSGDKDSRLTRRIHDAFAWSPGLDLVSLQRRPFYLTSLLRRSVSTAA